MAQGFINDCTTDYHSLKSRAMGGAPNRQRSDHFDVLNRHLRTGLVTPGQLVIIPDDFSFSCRSEEAWLMRYGEQIRWRLEPSAGSAVINNYDLLQSLLANGSIGIGSATSAWARHLDEVAQTLEAIERLHQRLKGGGLDRGEFARQRQGLFRQLDAQLQGAARFGTGLRGNQSLKKVLGISTKSFLHKGEIAGYAQRVGAVAGAAVGGKYGAAIARRACNIVLGISMKGNGALACGVIGGAAGGYGVGNEGGDYGALLGGKILEVNGDLIFEPEGA